MNTTGPLVLVPDLEMIPATDLAPARREQLGCEPGDVVLSRRASRTPSRIVTGDLARFLSEFRTATPFVAALIAYCAAEGLEPEGQLDDTFAAIVPLISAGWLVPDGEAQRAADGYSHDRGSELAGYSILDRVQAVEDTEVYQAADAQGDLVALKVAKLPTGPDTLAQFDNETAVLADCPGWPMPHLVSSGRADGRAVLATEWLAGAPITLVARDLRATGNRRGLLDLARSAVAAYARLHETGIVHGDVYPRNILVAGDGTVWLVDFGHGSRAGVQHPPGWLRKGSPEFYDPQFAASLRARADAPDPSCASDQYALGAVLYSLFTGAHYLDLSPRAPEMLDQIIGEPPVPFHRRGVNAWPDLERTILTTLAKDPAERFASMRELGLQLGAVRPPHDRTRGRPSTRERREAREFVDSLSPHRGAAVDGFPKASVAHGAAGVAAAFLELAMSTDSARDLESADVWSQLAHRLRDQPDAFTSRELELTAERIGACSVHYGAPGTDLVRARVAQAMGDSRGVADAVEPLAALPTQPGAADLAMGRAGLLVGAALLLDGRGDEEVAGEVEARAMAEVRTIGEASMRSVLKGAVSPSHLGMAHGLAGQLYAALLWSEVSSAPPPAAVVEQLQFLLSMARTHGRGLRWPMQPPPAPTGYLESWCHGTPGHVLLWTSAARLVDADFLDVAERAAFTVADTEPVNATLCCGGAGRVHALLAMFRSTGDSGWLERARSQAIRAWRARTSLPNQGSLLQGALGPAVTLLTLDDPDRCTFPLLERWR